MPQNRLFNPFYESMRLAIPLTINRRNLESQAALKQQMLEAANQQAMQETVRDAIKLRAESDKATATLLQKQLEGAIQSGDEATYRGLAPQLEKVSGIRLPVETQEGGLERYVMPKAKPEKSTSTLSDDLKEYNFASDQFKAGMGPDPGPFSKWLKDIKQASKQETTVKVDVGRKGMVELSKEMAGSLVKEHEKVQGAVAGLENVQEARNILDKGIITGTGAEWLTNAGNFISSRLGVKMAADPVANTQAYTAMMGRQVGEIIKQFGAGTGLSDADREYARKIAGGEINVSEEALRKIIDINDRAYRNLIGRYNTRADQAMKRPGADQLPFDLRINIDHVGKSSKKSIENTQTSSTATKTTAPPEALEYLKQHPEVKNAFKEKYGYLPEGD